MAPTPVPCSPERVGTENLCKRLGCAAAARCRAGSPFQAERLPRRSRRSRHSRAAPSGSCCRGDRSPFVPLQPLLAPPGPGQAAAQRSRPLEVAQGPFWKAEALLEPAAVTVVGETTSLGTLGLLSRRGEPPVSPSARRRPGTAASGRSVGTSPRAQPLTTRCATRPPSAGQQQCGGTVHGQGRARAGSPSKLRCRCCQTR